MAFYFIKKKNQKLAIFFTPPQPPKCYNLPMSAKPTPPRSMEETLKTLVANQAAMRRELKNAKQDFKTRLGKEAAARKKLAAEFDAFKKGVKEYDNLPGIYYEKSSYEILLDETLESLRKGQIGGIRKWVTISGHIIGCNVLRAKNVAHVKIHKRLSRKDVLHFVNEQLPWFTDKFSVYTKGSNLIGAMVYKTLDRSKAVQEALSSGLLLFRAEGANGLRHITTPEDARKPKTARAKHKPHGSVL